MGKSNLLKEAIADAKAVRETALANARMRMEEAFTPRLQSMISAKLQNEDEMEDDEEVIDTPEVDVDVEPGADAEIEVPAEEPVEAPVEEPVAAEPAVEVPVEEPVAVDAEPAPDVDVEVEPEVAPEDDVEEEGYELDLESIIRELEAESNVDEDIEEPVFEAEHEDEDKDELEEGDGMQKTAQDGSKDTDKGMKTDKDVTSDLSGEQGPNPGVTQKSPDRGQPFSPEKGGELTPASTLKQNPKNAIYEEEGEDEEKEEVDEEINLDEILRELEEADLSASVPEEIPDASNPFKTMNEQLKTKVTTLTKDLKEHRQVIKYLKSKLNEVNLLNAKLLFTSKLFKANNLSNSQKMKVIESFDRAKTLREVKLVYSTIAESYSKVEQPVKKSVKNITESISGGASKPVASTKPSKEVINEGIVDENGAARLKKLAGIKKK